MNPKRVRNLKEGSSQSGPVVYWMSRDQRVNDNWALLYAQQVAIERKSPLVVVFNLVPSFLNAGLRQYTFMLKGLAQVQTQLRNKNIPFALLTGQPQREIPRFLTEHRVGVLVTDFDPLKIKREWKTKVAEVIDIPFFEVDAHNIVPCWVASSKQEFGAYTLRPKIHRLLDEFLDDFPILKKHPFPSDSGFDGYSPMDALRALKVDSSVPEADWIVAGEKSAHQMLDHFIKVKLCNYEQTRNDPTKDGQSNLSPYLHFGQLSAQRAAVEVTRCPLAISVKEAFLEELIVRRELADNFCFYNDHYDSAEGFPDWAKNTLTEHRKDKRPIRYSFEQLERAETGDELWNASQRQMVHTGKMHGYMRMYWGKKILEWTDSPEEVMRIAIALNDKYELDGRDPNGYVGIAWCIGGVHDRAWRERPIFGKIRYMSYNGCKSKFDVEEYIGHYANTQ